MTFFRKAGDRSSRRAASWTACGTNLRHLVRQNNDDVFVSQCFQAFERPDGIDASLGQGGLSRAQKRTQRFDRGGILPLVNQAVGRVTIPAVDAT